MPTATKTTKTTAVKSKETTEKVQRTQVIDPSVTDYAVVSTPPEFATGQGRPKSGLRLQIEAMEVGQWLNTNLEVEGEKRKMTSVRGITVDVTKQASGTKKFSVRESADGFIWVGRTL